MIAAVVLAGVLTGACHVPGQARVPPLSDGDAADGIAILEEIELNGTRQTIQIRTHSPEAPLLLYLAGGPSGSEMAWLRHYHPALEEHFVVVHWDQRGAAASYAAADWATITPEQFVEDTGALIDQLLARFERESLILVGNSWGSILGVRVAARWPSRIAAYVGVTQQVNVGETDRLGWQRTLERARAAGNEKDVERLETLGPPPYPEGDFTGHYLRLIRLQDKYGGTERSRATGSDQISVALGAPEYSWWDRVNFFRGMVKGWTHVYSQLLDLDFEREVPDLEMPVILFLSRDDITVPPDPAVRWLENLEAPVKRVVWFEDAGHTLTIDARDRFDEALIGAVLPLAEAHAPVRPTLARPE